MKQINIAFITDRMIKGHGVDLVVDRLADGLAKIGYNCKVYCNYFDETFINRKSYSIEKLHYFKPDANPVVYERRIRKLAPYLNSKDADLFIIQSFPFYSLVPRLNKPVLVVDHGIISVSGLPLKRRLRYKYMGISQNLSYFKKADKIVTVSKYLLNCLPKNLREKATFIYNGCDHYQEEIIGEEEINNFRNEIGVNPKDILLLFVGRLNLTNQPYKGLSELIDIYQNISKKHKNIKLLTVGYGSKNDEELLRNQGILSIRNASEELMPLIYRSCDIYTTCSSWEGFDLPIAEAHSFERPTLCYSIGAHPEISSDGKTGFVVKNKKEFIEKLEILVNNPELRKEMGAEAREYSKRFSWENSVKQYHQIIKKMLNLKNSDITAKPSIDRHKPHPGKDVSVIIVNYNSSYPVLKECLDSIKTQTHKNIEIIIFDNNSTCNILEDIKKEFKDIKIIFSKKNLGLGEGINQALKYANSDLVLISNFDVSYNQDAFEQMVNSINSLESTYLGVAPKVKFYYQKDFLESTGIYLDTNLYIGHYGLGQLDLSQYNRAEDIFGVSFVSCLIKRDAFLENKVGLIDPTLFLFYEDVDFCYRANLHGYKFRSCPSAICYHKYAYSFRDEAAAFQTKYYYHKLNLLKTAYKNAEFHNLNRIISNELNIQKQNLKDVNLKVTARKIMRDFKKDVRHLRSKRNYMQFSRQIFDTDIVKYSWGEKVYFDIVKNEPIYSIENLHHSYRRLFALMGNERYGLYVNYLVNLKNTKFKMETDLFKNILHSKLEYEPLSVYKFIDKIQ
ncbi:MAG: glycosyltransferase [Actinobacteria bacterium]|nr:glycosyltransferase [Actinomycetota bacterium]